MTNFLGNRRNFEKIMKSTKKSAKLCENLENFQFGEVQRSANLVDLEKRSKMSIYLQKSASIQPRTSFSKFGG